MWLDALALTLLALFVAVGVLRGALTTVMGLLALGGSYAAAIVAAPRLGPLAADRLSLPEPLGMAAAGSIAFLAAYIVLGGIAGMVRRRERRRTSPRTPQDRFLGAVFGAVRGGLVVLLLSWLALWVDALRTTGTAEILPPIDSSSAAAVTSAVVEAGVEAVLSDSGPSSRLVARIAAHPGVALVEVQGLVENPRLDQLRSDAMFWTYVENGAVDAAMNRGSFQGLIHDESLRRQMAALGLIEEEAAADARAFRAAAGDMLRELGPRLKALRSDPELQRLVADPELQGMLESGDTLALVSHPGFRQIVARVAAPRDTP
jgi:uncharacterized membrane protein required for colicin V production